MKNTKCIALWLGMIFPMMGSLGHAQTEKAGGAALQGMVRSADEGPMEGVVVNARKTGSNIEISVYSDREGKYHFPADRLAPGKYDLSTWAVGYDSAQKTGTEIVSGKPATANFDLAKLQDKSKFAMQLSHSEWEMTLDNRSIRPCGGCHAIGYVMTRSYTADQWEKIIFRMKNHGEGSSIRSSGYQVVPRWKVEEPLNQADRQLAQFLSTVAGPENLPKLQFKTLPRPTGIGGKVIITTYDFERKDSSPHDVAIDSEGMLWHGNIAMPYLGRLDPRTGEDRAYSITENLKALGLPPTSGTTDLEFDNEGNPWFGVQSGGALGKLDKKTGKITLFPMIEGPVSFPLEEGQISFRTAMIAAGFSDGKIWTQDTGDHQRKHVHRFDPRTKELEHFPLPDKEKHALYGITEDTKGNAYFAGLRGNTFGRVDGKTGEITYYTPPTPNSAPRRIQADGKDRVWFGEFAASRLAMFDPETGKIREWILGSHYVGAYDAAPDKNGDNVWVSGNYDDRIYRLDTRTDKIVSYVLPRSFSNVQRLSADLWAKVPTVWVAEDNYGKTARIEVLEESSATEGWDFGGE